MAVTVSVFPSSDASRRCDHRERLCAKEDPHAERAVAGRRRYWSVLLDGTSNLCKSSLSRPGRNHYVVQGRNTPGRQAGNA